MITGKLTMNFTPENCEVECNLEMTKGLADKCFIINSVCKALQMDEKEKDRAFALISVAGLLDRMEDKNEG